MKNEDGKKSHPTQKPEAPAPHRILVGTANPGAVVLDPFFGTSTTKAPWPRLLGRSLPSRLERDKDYVEVRHPPHRQCACRRRRRP